MPFVLIVPDQNRTPNKRFLQLHPGGGHSFVSVFDSAKLIDSMPMRVGSDAARAIGGRRLINGQMASGIGDFGPDKWVLPREVL
ncbi:hypothetical protein K1T71_011065 [Dendrolimus kikuchii]|uniref:Uncharacterized protein n=1 Tax=Dendrolimus kikuchii TaxID=765133 RepID=A0ACC1CMS9_9NEOP|nr:hypothetical protein K1T71_011065 [Dendrolimus kikuchii]